MKIITRRPDPDKVIKCTCRKFRPDTFARHNANAQTTA